MGIRRQLNGLLDFKKDRNYYVVIDMIARQYGKFPHEVTKLDYDELYLAIYCLVERSKRINGILKKNNRKKSMTIPTINILDFADII